MHKIGPKYWVRQVYKSLNHGPNIGCANAHPAPPLLNKMKEIFLLYTSRQTNLKISVLICTQQMMCDLHDLCYAIKSYFLFILSIHLHLETILVWKSTYMASLVFENVFKNYTYFTLFIWNWNWHASFFRNPPDSTRQNLKCIKTNHLLMVYRNCRNLQSFF